MPVARDLLPLPPIDRARRRQSDLSRSVRRRLEKKGHWLQWADDAATSLNDLAGSGTFDVDVLEPSESQIACLTRLTICFAEVGCPPSDLTAAGAFDALCGTSAGYSFDSMPRASLQPDFVSLPPVGLSFATGVDILADGDHSLWSDWQSLLLREPAE